MRMHDHPHRAPEQGHQRHCLPGKPRFKNPIISHLLQLDSRIIVRPPTLVRCNFPLLSQLSIVHLLRPPKRSAASGSPSIAINFHLLTNGPFVQRQEMQNRNALGKGAPFIRGQER
jgi:hypothetical protein